MVDVGESQKRKVALVTGGTRGIGREIVRALLAHDYDVCFTYVESAGRALELERDNKGSNLCKGFKSNSCTRTEIISVVDYIEREYGYLNVLVNNAGINKPTDFEDVTDSDWDHILNTNLKGPFIVTQECVGILKASGSSSVIHIGSVSGQYGGPRTPHYAASKAGLISLSQVIARYGAPHGIRSNCVSAGLIQSEMAEQALANPSVKAATEQILLNRFGSFSDVANAVIFLASENSSYITAQTINVNGGLYF